MQADATVDALGMYCPMPIILTSRKIKELQAGQVLQVIADDEGIKEDMPAWCRSTGNEFLGIEEHGGEYRAYVRKVMQ